ncbi:anthranilate synthase component I [Thomasclavelia saccharogumia]|uniref:anthranilate synthase component I n=1 Tax=Thomasclavelia saccharogumia TaxID=341225 RepID=UPI00047B4FB5|nr:anthranilate synthase component I [Thomasclavelia saccharogumia]
MYYPTLDQVKEIIKNNEYDLVPISKEIYGDSITPIEVMRILKNYSKHCYMLESVDDTKRWGRYTFMGYKPKSEITCLNNVMNVDGKEFKVDHPGIYIKELLKRYRSPKIAGLPTFTGGLVGYFAYDYFKYSEPVLNLKSDDKEGFNDVDLMLFDQVICFDNYKQKIILIANAKVKDLDDSYQKATAKLDKLHELIIKGLKARIEPLKLKGEFNPLFSQDEYCSMVNKAKKYIKEGDIFQIVLSNHLEAKASGSLFDTYRVLRTTNPSPYMFYFSSDNQEIAGASPETLVKLEDQTLYTYPLAGTRPRGKDEREDKQFEEILLTDQKELAEHNMLVDLGRNDIGKIAKFGSVTVEKYLEILRFSHVMHIGSTVSGTILDNLEAVDAIDALLPAGTLSGAPKIRACQIINELENDRRGIYGGAVGYIDFTGNLDTCIAIRLAYKKNDKVHVRSGAGIVYDSIPENEYQECLNKAKAVVKALEIANGGIEQ